MLDKGLPIYKKFDNFVKDNADWLKDYSMFMSLKANFDQKSWGEWDDDIKFRSCGCYEEVRTGTCR